MKHSVTKKLVNRVGVPAIALVLGASGCVDDPKKKLLPNADINIWNKQDFASVVSTGSAQGSAKLFIDEAMANIEKRQDDAAFEALGLNRENITNVRFSLSKDKLSMFIDGKTRAPIAQWEISHCFEKVVKNQRSENTRFLEYDCESNPDTESNSHFKVAPNKQNSCKLNALEHKKLISPAKYVYLCN